MTTLSIPAAVLFAANIAAMWLLASGKRTRDRRRLEFLSKRALLLLMSCCATVMAVLARLLWLMWSSPAEATEQRALGLATLLNETFMFGAFAMAATLLPLYVTWRLSRSIEQPRSSASAEG